MSNDIDYCFYHGSDLDGECSAAIVLRKHPSAIPIPVDYGEPFPWDLDLQGKRVAMVDFSLDLDGMLAIANSTNYFVWLDHHKTALAMQDVLMNLPSTWGVQRTDFAACQLCWWYFFDPHTPRAVELIGSYDTWKLDDPDVLPFQHGMQTWDTAPKEPIWEHLLNDYAETVQNILKDGSIVLRYRRRLARSQLQRCAFPTTYAQHRVLAVNLNELDYSLSSCWDSNAYNILAAFSWQKDHWIIQLRSRDGGPDVSEIAKDNKGGGHEHAAGFTTETLPEWLRNGMVKANVVS